MEKKIVNQFQADLTDLVREKLQRKEGAFVSNAILNAVIITYRDMRGFDYTPRKATETLLQFAERKAKVQSDILSDLETIKPAKNKDSLLDNIANKLEQGTRCENVIFLDIDTEDLM